MFFLCRNQRTPRTACLLLIATLGLLLTACNRGGGNSSNQAGNSNPAGTNTTSELQAGGKQPTPEGTNPAGDSATAIEEGKRLYSAYNCNGCHSAGGGGMGPPLMDDQWIYGGKPEQIFATIVEGRPNGMPSFRTKIPDAEIWQLAAFVRSLSEQASKQEGSSRTERR